MNYSLGVSARIFWKCLWDAYITVNPTHFYTSAGEIPVLYTSGLREVPILAETFPHPIKSIIGSGPSLAWFPIVAMLTCSLTPGYYAFIETSSPRRQGENARLISGPFSDVQCLHFSYSMIGKTIGSLNIYLQLHGLDYDLWSKKGPQGYPEWHSTNVTVYGKNYYVSLYYRKTKVICFLFIGLSEPFVIGHSEYIGFSLTKLNWKPLYSVLRIILQ